jgi:hypothetical protein
MANISEQILQKQLVSRVSKFLARDESSRRRALLSTVERIREHGWRGALFGGTLRDLMLYGVSRPPRDVDIVVDGPTADELARAFADLGSRRTRFGGLHLQFEGWTFDVWPLSETWAFRHLDQPASERDFASLPKTTFLNLEAVAVELAPSRAKMRRVYTNGFFEALANRRLEINFEDNPFPALCVVRTLTTAAGLQFSMGPRLSRYLVHYGRLFSGEELAQIQMNHYGWCRFTASQFEIWLNTIKKQYQAGMADLSGVRLPLSRGQQLKLFERGTPACEKSDLSC